MALPILGIILVLVIIIIGAAIGLYNHKVEIEKELLFTSIMSSEIITEEDLDSLPNAMKNYLLKVGILGKPKHSNVQFLQRGVIKTHPEKKGRSFKATQYMSTHGNGFIWKARSFPILVRDKYLGGQGEVKVNLLGLKDLTVQANYETTQSSLGRYFGELLWCPMGFLDKDIRWEEMTPNTVKGVITKDGVSFAGYFHFTDEGFIDTFRGQRYRDTSLEDFLGVAKDYQNHNGLLIPRTMTASWELESGPLEYFKAEISNYKLWEK
ncbi:MAG: DUF6544 family protein [Bacteroidota bacterium]